ncbi:DUF1566 domain-containing protein [Thiococcus pfennigii]|uniref:Lcl C-terminal domain-containing protein n=1 Tax=Thiococcus pfennigii TaxID=1057 RepID=UPI001902E27C|nr:DUF1566 domain-containing protein [Thiococcus pfennigii]
MRGSLVFLCLAQMATPLVAQQACNQQMLYSTPAGTFLDNGNGTVTDVRNGLMWKRCAEGQSWQVSGCMGLATRVDWASAMEGAADTSFAGYDDWRLPNIKELNSILERACRSPAIDATVFPATPSSAFWSSSPDNQNPWSLNNYSFKVYFTAGGTFYGARDGYEHVRLVRSVP